MPRRLTTTAAVIATALVVTACGNDPLPQEARTQVDALCEQAGDADTLGDVVALQEATESLLFESGYDTSKVDNAIRRQCNEELSAAIVRGREHQQEQRAQWEQSMNRALQ